MNAKTLAALKGSIRKWEDILAERDTDQGVSNCPLCRRFYRPTRLGDYCYGCPVRARTGRAFCDGSPHDQWNYVDEAYHPRVPGVIYEHGDLIFGHLTVEGYIAARKELEFLKSLLPKDEQHVEP